jgi:flagellar basal-body rod modification protein FlgD
MTMQIASNSSPQVDTGTTSNTSSAETSSSALGKEQVFLQLLVAQIKNQDPLNPTDGTQFMSQLAQFSSLEQLISLNTTVGNIGTTLGVTSDGSQTSSSGNAST